MKVPDTLEALLDLMRAKGVATFEWEERGEGGTVLKHSLDMFERAFDEGGFSARPYPSRVLTAICLTHGILHMDPTVPAQWRHPCCEAAFRATGVDATPQDIAAPDIAPKPIVPRGSDIELALNPPALDFDAPDEGADPEGAVASLEAPREKAPVGAAEPDDAP